MGISLRPGNAGANKAADLITAVDAAIATLPQRIRDSPQTILVRSDAGGFTHNFIDHLQNLGVQYSVSRPLWAWMLSALDITPDHKRENALDAHGDPREGVLVLEVGNAHEYLKTRKPWPKGMRVIFRAEPLHPGASHTWVDAQGRRVTAFATNTPHIPGLHAGDVDRRHRGRARMEQTIGCAKDTGLTYWPYQAAAKNQVWASIITLATNLLSWLSQSVLEGKTARYEPKRLRYRILNTPARLSRHARKTRHPGPLPSPQKAPRPVFQDLTPDTAKPALPPRQTGTPFPCSDPRSTTKTKHQPSRQADTAPAGKPHAPKNTATPPTPKPQSETRPKTKPTKHPG